MKSAQIPTSSLELNLIEPDVKRDAPLSLQWLSGEAGEATLTLMGVPETEIATPTLEIEKQRIRDFLTDTDQLNWMIEYEGTVVGSIWVDLKSTKYLPTPALNMMLGDPAVRGKGIGLMVGQSMLDHLAKTDRPKVYSRHLIGNHHSKNLLTKLGFTKLDPPYTDEDGLAWQNLEYEF